MNTLFEDKYMKVAEDKDILSLIWKDETKNLSDEIFKVEALKFEETLRSNLRSNILVDMRDFNYQLSPELIAWRKENIISTYNELKVKKFAFITEKPAVNQDDPSNTFITRAFVSVDESVRWLNDK